MCGGLARSYFSRMRGSGDAGERERELYSKKANLSTPPRTLTCAVVHAGLAQGQRCVISSLLCSSSDEVDPAWRCDKMAFLHCDLSSCVQPLEIAPCAHEG
jgi:hypothetical protein